jgi:hypothetical protein
LFCRPLIIFLLLFFCHCGRDCTVVGFTTTCAISAYQGVLDTTLCDKVYHRLATGQWFSLDTSVCFTNKTDHHNITEILLKVALNAITHILWPLHCLSFDLQLLITTLESSNFSGYLMFMNKLEAHISQYSSPDKEDRLNHCLSYHMLKFDLESSRPCGNQCYQL